MSSLTVEQPTALIDSSFLFVVPEEYEQENMMQTAEKEKPIRGNTAKKISP